MASSFRCDACGFTIPFTPADAGKRGPCPGCGGPVQAPLLDTAVSSGIAPTSSGSADDRTRPLPSPPSRRPGSLSERTVTLGPSDTELAREIEKARADPARRFGPFVVLSELGKGGMGVVYRAWNDRLRRVVALKTILAGEGVDQEAIARFHREAEATARLRHPNIVAVHDAGEIEGRHYIAMDFVSGRSLDARLKPGEGKIAFHRALEVVRDVARAVHYAHTQGVVHRDLKPQNIIIDASDRPFVLDFGLAAIKGSGTKLTKTGMSMGTPAYMPPEQANGEPTDERSDVYSLGAVLYQVLTGKPPFSGDNDVNLIVAVLTKDPEPPGKLSARAAGDLETICLQCLEKEPERRYASADDVAAELDRYLRGEPISARPLGPVARALRWTRRNRLRAAFVVALLAAVLGIAGSQVQASVRERAAALAARGEVVGEARTDAGSKREAFFALRSARKLERESEEDRRKRQDTLLASGLDALEAGSRAAALGGEDEDRRVAAEVALALASVALDAEQWSVAATAFEKARKLGAREAVDGPSRVEHARTEVQKKHRDEVEKVLAEARLGETFERSSGAQEAVFRLVRLPEAQTVRLLAAALDDVAAKLRAGGAVDEKTDAVLAKIACEALGRIGIADGATEALRRLLLVGSDGPLAVEAGIALCRLGTAEAEQAVLEVADARYGFNSLFWKEVSPRLDRTSRPQGAPTSSTELRVHSAALLVKGDFAGAIADLSRAIDLDPGRASSWTARGAVRIKAGDAKAALADFTHALELDPGSVEALSDRGNLRANKGDTEGGIADLTRALELDPKFVPALLNRGGARMRNGDLAGALADYTRVTEIDPNSWHGWNDRAMLRWTRGERDGALADITHAIDVAPREPSVWSMRAWFRFEKGDCDGSISDASRALELDPRCVPALDQRALARANNVDLPGAITDLTRLIELQPRSAAYWEQRADVRRRMGDIDRAIEDYAMAQELDPKRASAFDRCARLRAGKNDHAGAVADYAKVLELQPKNAEVWNNSGWSRHLMKDDAGADADLSKALEIDPRMAVAWLNRGVAREALGRRDDARGDFERYLELDSKGPRADLARQRIAVLAR